VIQVVACERLAPVFEYPDEGPAREVCCNLVLERERESDAVEGGDRRLEVLGGDARELLSGLLAVTAGGVGGVGAGAGALPPANIQISSRATTTAMAP